MPIRGHTTGIFRMKNRNGFYRLMTRVFDLMLLNLMTAVGCIPVITGGAAAAGMHSCLIKMHRGEDPEIIRTWRKSFRENLRQGMVLSMIAALIIADLYAVRQMPAGRRETFGGIAAAAGLAAAAVFSYVFPFLARYRDTVGGTIRKSAGLALVYFPKTILMLLIAAGACFLYWYFNLYILPVILLFGLSGPAYLQMLIYDPIFQRLEKQEE